MQPNGASTAVGARPPRATASAFRQVAAGAVAMPWAVPLALAVAAAVTLWVSIAPLNGSTNDTDAASSVLYFQRIAAGRHLEAFVPTTPKPLLTVVFGAVYSLAGDWRWLTVLTIAAAAVAVGLAARMVERIGGGVWALLAAVGLLAWPDFRVEVAHANSFVWGLLLWFAAGALLFGVRDPGRRRAVGAGLALLLATLARPETLALVGAAGVVVAWSALESARRKRPTRALTVALPLLLGALAWPLASLHDLLLTGDPLYWTRVSSAYTITLFGRLAPVGTLEYVRDVLVPRYEALLPALALGAIGVVALVRRGRRGLAFALVALAAGVLALLTMLAHGGVYLTDRYFEEADAPVILLAAIGLGWLTRSALSLTVGAGRTGGLRRATRVGVAVAVVAAVGVGFGVGVSRIGEGGADLGKARAAEAALEAVMRRLSPIVAGATGGTVEQRGVDYPVADLASARIFVPRGYVPQLAVETGVPTTVLGDSRLAFRNGMPAFLRPGQWLLRIPAVDGLTLSIATLSGATVDGPEGRVRLVPVVADPQRGVWLFRVEAAS